MTDTLKLVGPLDISAPERVWLQVDTDGDPEDRTQAMPRDCWMDLTWHYESIGGQEVVYIREDIARRAVTVTDEMVGRARKVYWENFYGDDANSAMRAALTAALSGEDNDRPISESLR